MTPQDDWTFEHLPLPGLLWAPRWSGELPRTNVAFTRAFSLLSLLARLPELARQPDGAALLRLERPDGSGESRVCRLEMGTRPDGSRLALVVDLQAEYQDVLTGLEDRRALLLDAAQTPGEGGSLALLDIDGFKEVNDTLGHAAGDDVLCALAGLLAAAARGWGARAYRLGGDEFVVRSPGALVPAQLAGVQAQFARRLADYALPARRRGLTPRSFSYGLAHAPDDGHTLAELLRCADARLAGSKERRRGTQAAQFLRLAGEAPRPAATRPGWPSLKWPARRNNA